MSPPFMINTDHIKKIAIILIILLFLILFSVGGFALLEVGGVLLEIIFSVFLGILGKKIAAFVDNSINISKAFKKWIALNE